MTAIRNSWRAILASSASFLVLATPAHAQSVDAEASSGAGESGEEIVVTAQRRQERLVDVPISISVLGGETLDRSSNSSVIDALKTVPGVTAYEFAQTGGSQISIRGITATGAITFGASPVSYYVDAVPFGLARSAVAPNSNAYDLERVEVLRGPQGTLFGVGSPAGTVRVLTHAAEFDTYSMKARVGFSQVKDGTQGVRSDAAVNIPLIPGTAAIRLVAGYEKFPGWVDKPNDRDANDGHAWQLRLRADAEPAEAFNISLTGWLSRKKLNASSRGYLDYTSPFLAAEPIESDFDMVGLKATYDFGPFSLTSATSYLNYAIKSQLDASTIGVAGNNVLTTNLAADLFAEELTLNSSGDGPWRWTLGGMYRYAKDSVDQMRRNLITGAPINPYLVGPAIYDDISRSYAVFGEVTRSFADGRVELTGGLRWFHDEARSVERARSSAAPTPTSPLVDVTDTFEKVSPRVVAAFHPTERSTIYLSYSEGFRSGFQQAPTALVAAPGLPSVRPDNLVNYEVGAKGDLFGGLLSVEAAAYYVKWDGVQLRIGFPFGASSQSAILNAVSASGPGVEVAATLRPARRLSISGSFSLNDILIDDDVFNTSNNAAPVRAFRKGDRLPVSPRITAGVDVDYAIPLSGDGAELIFTYGGHYTSKRYETTLIGTAFVTRAGEAFFLSDARVAYDSGKGWRASLYGTNLTDERGWVAFRDLNGSNSLQTPRTFGVQLDLDF